MTAPVHAHDWRFVRYDDDGSDVERCASCPQYRITAPPALRPAPLAPHGPTGADYDAADDAAQAEDERRGLRWK